MPKQDAIVIAAGKESDYTDSHFAHAVRAGDLLFLSGQTAVQPDGSMPDGLAAQARGAFAALNDTLTAAGLTFADVVSITTYHVDDLVGTIWDFFAVKEEFVPAPYPAWTAVGVKDLAHAGALIEIAAVATFK